MTDELKIWKDRVSRTLRSVLSLIGVLLVVMVVGFVFAVVSFRSQAQDQTEAAKTQAQSARMLTEKIQEERKASIVITCEDTNERNANALEQARRLPLNTHASVFNIINQLAPTHEDCASYASTRVKAK